MGPPGVHSSEKDPLPWVDSACKTSRKHSKRPRQQKKNSKIPRIFLHRGKPSTKPSETSRQHSKRLRKFPGRERPRKKKKPRKKGQGC